MLGADRGGAKCRDEAGLAYHHPLPDIGSRESAQRYTLSISSSSQQLRFFVVPFRVLCSFLPPSLDGGLLNFPSVPLKDNERNIEKAFLEWISKRVGFYPNVSTKSLSKVRLLAALVLPLGLTLCPSGCGRRLAVL